MELTITLVIKFALGVQIICTLFLGLFDAIKIVHQISYYPILDSLQKYYYNRIVLLSNPSWRLW